jgi:hypothetical protein
MKLTGKSIKRGQRQPVVLPASTAKELYRRYYWRYLHDERAKFRNAAIRA